MARIQVEVEETLVERVRTTLGATTKWETVEFALRQLLGKLGARSDKTGQPRGLQSANARDRS